MPIAKLVKAYIIDTSSLIKLKLYPHEIKTFEPIWNTLEEMVQEKRLLAPLDVYREILKGDDIIASWCKQNKKMFVDEEKLVKFIAKVKREYDNADKTYWSIQSNKIGPWADPWVIALSLAMSYYDSKAGEFRHPPIITEEKDNSPTKIPSIAKRFGIPCMSLLEFFVEIGL